MPRTVMRTAGIWIVDGYILFSRGRGMKWGVPGGGLEPDESAEAGCLREYREELGLEMQVVGLALIHENFWPNGDDNIREYGFYFRVQPKLGHAIVRTEVQCREDNLEIGWFRFTDLAELDLVPVALKSILPKLKHHTLFVSTRE